MEYMEEKRRVSAIYGLGLAPHTQAWFPKDGKLRSNLYKIDTPYTSSQQMKKQPNITKLLHYPSFIYIRISAKILKMSLQFFMYELQEITILSHLDIITLSANQQKK